MSGGRNISPRRMVAHDGWRFVDIGDTLNDFDDQSQLSSASYAGAPTHQTTINLAGAIGLMDYLHPKNMVVWEWTALDRNGDTFEMDSGILIEVKIEVISGLDASNDVAVLAGFSNGALNSATTEAFLWGAVGDSANSERHAFMVWLEDDVDSPGAGNATAGVTYYHGTATRVGTDNYSDIVIAGEDSDGLAVGSRTILLGVNAIAGTARFCIAAGRVDPSASTASPVVVVGYRVTPAPPTGGKLLS